MSSVADWGSIPHSYTSSAVVALDSSSFVVCWDFKAAPTSTNLWTGELHCFVLEVSGSSVTNADVAVNTQGQKINDRYGAHFGMDRASDSSTFVICWQVNPWVGCALFAVSGRAVSEVSQDQLVPDILKHPENPAVGGLTGTSAVVCGSGHTNNVETSCALMRWTAGDLNSFTFDAVKPSIAARGYHRTLTRLSDGKSLLCFVNRGPYGTSLSLWFQECVMVVDTGIELQMTRVINITETSGGADQNAHSQRTIALGRNKAVTIFDSRRRQGHMYTLTMDIDEQTNQVTQAGPDVKIDNKGEWGDVAKLGSDRAFAVFSKGASPGPLKVAPLW